VIRIKPPFGRDATTTVAPQVTAALKLSKDQTGSIHLGTLGDFYKALWNPKVFLSGALTSSGPSIIKSLLQGKSLVSCAKDLVARSRSYSTSRIHFTPALGAFAACYALNKSLDVGPGPSITELWDFLEEGGGRSISPRPSSARSLTAVSS
jgi:hypothetical protein